MSQKADRAAPRVLPGRHELSREFLEGHQRRRIMTAVAELIAERGYRDVTVADIVKRAGIARNTFYDHFSSKEESFLAAFDAAVEGARARAGEAYEAAGEPWPKRIQAGLGALLRYVAADATLARMCFVEALSAGPAAVERYEGALRAFVPMLKEGRKLTSSSADLPETTEESIIGGVSWIVYQRINQGQVETLVGILPELVEFVLIPYVGSEQAKDAAGRPDPLEPEPTTG